MTMRLPSSLLLGCAALLFFATLAEAQVLRPSNTLYLGARVGVGLYSGDLDARPDASISEWFSDPGIAAGAELGYQFSPSFALALGYVYGTYPALDGHNYTAPDPRAGLNASTVVHQAQLMFRYLPFSRSRISPYVELGGAAAFGQGDETGFGPLVGLGVDIALGNRMSFFLGGHAAFIFPDRAVDDWDEPFPDNTYAYDGLAQLGGGLRFFFRPAGVPVQATIDCPTSLTVGQAGTFQAFVNDDATGPVSYNWNFGDGGSGTGMTSSHTYRTPGTYTVTFTATGPVNADTETCVVTVQEVPAEAPVLTNCRANPTRAAIGETVQFSATSRGTAPISYSFDFGDGTTQTATSPSASHTYTEEGTYTVTISATSAAGTDQCVITVTVGDPFCDEITELNTVFFDYRASTLTAEAQSRLDENIEVLNRCPNICVVVNAYADDSEANALRLSEQRADATRAYYERMGIAPNRIMARGLGVFPGSRSKEDPGPGDRNARRAESIPVNCDQMQQMN
ncbi:hypothetical protein BH23BAC4_BH23BAC4_12060 [soil metagenome]